MIFCIYIYIFHIYINIYIFFSRNFHGCCLCGCCCCYCCFCSFLLPLLFRFHSISLFHFLDFTLIKYKLILFAKRACDAEIHTDILQSNVKVDGYNKSVQTQYFGENEDQNHTDEQTWLLCCASYTSIANDTNGKTSS